MENKEEKKIENIDKHNASVFDLGDITTEELTILSESYNIHRMSNNIINTFRGIKQLAKQLDKTVYQTIKFLEKYTGNRLSKDALDNINKYISNIEFKNKYGNR